MANFDDPLSRVHSRQSDRGTSLGLLLPTAAHESRSTSGTSVERRATSERKSRAASRKNGSAELRFSSRARLGRRGSDGERHGNTPWPVTQYPPPLFHFLPLFRSARSWHSDGKTQNRATHEPPTRLPLKSYLDDTSASESETVLLGEKVKNTLFERKQSVGLHFCKLRTKVLSS